MKKKCEANIVQGNRATTTLTYTGVIVHYKKKKEEVMQFFFCNDDIERCMKGTRRRWVKSRPDVLNAWLAKHWLSVTTACCHLLKETLWNGRASI
jgi:hypothetical protein